MKRRKSGLFLTKKCSKSLENIRFFPRNSPTRDGDNTHNVTGTRGSEFSVDIDSESDAGTGCDISEPTEKQCSWREGRRIVEIGHLADQLWCCDCGGQLSLSDISNETRHGYGSLLYISCACGIINTVETNKRHRLNKRGPKVFDVNTKAALGMLHSGSGTRQIESFMAVLEVPTLHPSSMKDRESELAQHIESVAKETCSKALTEEVQLTRSSIWYITDFLGSSSHLSTKCSSQEDPSEVPSGEFKYDMGWQKRGSGRCYDSKSGVGTLFGNKSGKIVAYDVRSKDCRKCSYHFNKGMDPPEHTCSKNWCGSSKSMEPDVGCNLVLEVESKNVNVGVMIMDDDATTMAKIKTAVSHPIVKWSDLNHTKKHLGNSMYALQKKHKCLTTKVIQYFQKCFSYAVCQNKENPSSLASVLCQIVPHAFGNHENCGSWCTFHKDPENYKHSSTAYGKDLTGIELRKDLDQIFNKFASNAEKIAPGASTKEVESFNNMLAAKAPKRCHYSASRSLKNRLSCAVAQKNSGNSYINQVNTKAGISPGKFYAKLAAKRDKCRVKRLQFENTKLFKQRKLDKKLKNKHNSIQKELREGVSYQSGVALSNICDITEIPGAVTRPTSCRLHQENISVKVYCDIETTSLLKTCDITQLAAVCGEEKFDCYILPSQPISRAASEITGLTVNDNRMFHNGRPVESQFLKNALVLFLSWLQCRGKCVLIGHNFWKFDLPRIIRAFEMCNLLSAFEDVVLGSIDTLPLFKYVYPDLSCYKQEHLVSTFINAQYSAHNALADVQSLQQLLSNTITDFHTLVEHSESLSSSIILYKFDKDCDYNKSTMECLINDKVVSKEIVRKISHSGLCLQHLQLAISRNGLDGLTQLFKEKSLDGKPRVTSLKRIIESVFKYLGSLQKEA